MSDPFPRLRTLSRFLSLLMFPTAISSVTHLPAADWEAKTLPVELTVGYAVRCLDISGDGKLDIAIADAKRFLWLEAPDWRVHVIHATPQAKADNVCFAPRDIDGDGDIDFAVGTDWQPNNTRSGGAVGWLESPADPRDPWKYHPIESTFPTIHRMQWLDLDGDADDELVVAPLKGRNSNPPGFDDQGVELTRFNVQRGNNAVAWSSSLLTKSFTVMHNIHPFPSPWNASKEDLLTASFEGVHWLSQRSDSSLSRVQLGVGHEAAAPACGASEVRLGQAPENRRFIATIEPWHGNQVVVYEQPASFQWKETSTHAPWPRQVIDRELKWGHAVACGNLDDDPEDEIVVGVRDEDLPHRCGVRVYDRAIDGKWIRQLIEPGQVAVEDLVLADLDGDGKLEIVAVGRATKNAVLYRQKP